MLHMVNIRGVLKYVDTECAGLGVVADADLYERCFRVVEHEPPVGPWERIRVAGDVTEFVGWWTRYSGMR